MLKVRCIEKKMLWMWKFVYLWRRCCYLLVCKLTKIIKGSDKRWWLHV